MIGNRGAGPCGRHQSLVETGSNAPPQQLSENRLEFRLRSGRDGLRQGIIAVTRD
jgi:hypothetical protein